MIQVKEMMQDNDLKNSKSKDKGSKSRSQSMDEQSHYKQDKTISRQSINVKRHIFDVIGGTEEFEKRDLNIGGDCLDIKLILSMYRAKSPREAKPGPFRSPYASPKAKGIDLGPRCEVGESSAAAAARPIRGRRADYGFVDTVDAKISRRRAKEVGYGIRDAWVDPRDQSTESRGGQH
ncbi:hypothetical protein Tco_0551228 [Tanacetum coccineum]